MTAYIYDAYCTEHLLYARPLSQGVNNKSFWEHRHTVSCVCAPVEKSDSLVLKQKSPILCEFISTGQDLRGPLVLASEAHGIRHICDLRASTTLHKPANHACAIKQLTP